MPAITPGAQARPCPADEQLLLAHEHESREMEHYRGLALSFLPTRPHVSRLMAALGIECEQRIGALEALAEKLQLRDLLMYAPSRYPSWAEVRRHHLFITDDAMACQALSHALAVAHHSRQFSELMARYCHLPELDALLVQFIEHKRAACHLLEEAQAGAYAVPARA
ncbi:hypothetical protein QLQ86_11350 [Halomonas sp. LR5S13]|uniref:hypothetical protein n=1 Tax=Halomonas rhizosphaerae TaxID=3043296 RepID=UPI0024A86B0B|nr:hypothetical protein [Halomonas rhizosphaerae]MDI5921382.1 hypothetical protein [Halomonas rhizosphaerae]